MRSIYEYMRFLRPIVFASLLISFGLQAQTEFRNREFSIVNENDVYLFLGIDRYYSNGMFFNYRFLPKNKKSSKKVIYEVGLAQRFWTPQDLRIINPEAYYRPYAGLLNGNFQVAEFPETYKRISYGIELGVMGKASGAQAFQEWYHKQFGFPQPQGWKNQIPNGFVFNFSLEYNRQFVLVPSRFDLITTSAMQLGNAFVNARQRIDLRFGHLRSLSKSAFVNALIGEGSRSMETHNYFFLGYGLEGVVHNATIQGHAFNANAPHTEEIMPWVRHMRLGWATSSENSTLKVTYNWLSKEVRGRAGRHAYIGLELQLRFVPKRQ